MFLFYQSQTHPHSYCVGHTCSVFGLFRGVNMSIVTQDVSLAFIKGEQWTSGLFILLRGVCLCVSVCTPQSISYTHRHTLTSARCHCATVTCKLYKPVLTQLVFHSQQLSQHYSPPHTHILSFSTFLSLFFSHLFQPFLFSISFFSCSHYFSLSFVQQHPQHYSLNFLFFFLTFTHLFISFSPSE